MSQNLKIGLILPGIPGYSETFIWSKIEGLIHCGNSVYLFVNNHKNSDDINFHVPIYSQPDKNNRIIYLITLLFLFLKCPFRVIKFIKWERYTKVNWVGILKHLIINSHILNQKIDWIHFEFATMGIGRENLARAMGVKSTVSFRGYDIGLFPFTFIWTLHLNTGPLK